MCRHAASRTIVGVGVFSVILLHLPDVPADQGTADWWKAQRDVSALLMERGLSITELAADVNAAIPENAQDAMFNLSVLMRAGLNNETIMAIRKLKELSPQIENHQVSCIYYEACDNVSAWDIAQATVEVFADDISEVTLGNRLLKHFLNSGWTIERVDAWLAGMPKGIGNFWVKERLRFNHKYGRSEPLVRELSDEVRKNPQDIEDAIMFLDELIYARPFADEKWDLSWMAGTIKPELATEAERMASGLKTLAKWTTATEFYEQAVNMPLTEEETRKLGMMCAIFVPRIRLRAMFATQVREGMAECWLELGRNDQAQKWMVEAANIREEHNLGLNALFAGQVQAASGQRVIESRLEEEEKESESDPQYWRERARYYRGRSEFIQEEALLRGLELTTPQIEPEQPSKAPADCRSLLLADYARLLAGKKRTDEAVAFLEREIEEAPASSESARKAALLLASKFEQQINVEDEILWSWLADRWKWEHTEKLFPNAAKRLTPSELPEWYSRVAVAAARSGAKADAMPIWSRVANLNPSQIDGLEDLAEAGLRAELKDFYREMRRRMPLSVIPAKALLMLKKE